MQLILTHSDLELALIESLRAKGMTAFEPGKASVEFTFKRGTKELQCVLDTEPKAPVAGTAATTSQAIQTITLEKRLETPATSPAPEQEAPAQEPDAPAPEPVVEAQSTEAALVTPAGDDDNLFD